MKHEHFTKYLPAKGFRIDKEEAQTIGEVIERLQTANDGAITAAMLLDSAKPVTSPIHDFFMWNDAQAGHLYRLGQARWYIKGIEIVVEHDGRKERQKANHLVQRGEERVYASFQTVVENQDMAEQVLAKAKQELVSWYHRYQRLERLNGMALVLEAIENSGIVKIHSKGEHKEPEEVELAAEIAMAANG